MIVWLAVAALWLQGDSMNRPPVLIQKCSARYTEEARAAKLEGIVLVSVEISTEGRAEQVKVVRSLGKGLDEKAVEGVRQWRFKPALEDGKPVVKPATIEVAFRLDDTGEACR